MTPDEKTAVHITACASLKPGALGFLYACLIRYAPPGHASFKRQADTMTGPGRKLRSVWRHVAELEAGDWLEVTRQPCRWIAGKRYQPPNTYRILTVGQRHARQLTRAAETATEVELLVCQIGTVASAEESNLPLSLTESVPAREAARARWLPTLPSLGEQASGIEQEGFEVHATVQAPAETRPEGCAASRGAPSGNGSGDDSISRCADRGLAARQRDWSRITREVSTQRSLRSCPTTVGQANPPNGSAGRGPGRDAGAAPAGDDSPAGRRLGERAMTETRERDQTDAGQCKDCQWSGWHMARTHYNTREWTAECRRWPPAAGLHHTDAGERLLQAMAAKELIDWPRALWRGAYMAATAAIAHNGIPIDAELYRRCSSLSQAARNGRVQIDKVCAIARLERWPMPHWGILDWRLHAVGSIVCALGAIADVAVGYPWIGLIAAFASGSCSMTAVDFWYRRKTFRQFHDYRSRLNSCGEQ